ncbi:MAG: peptidyl-prolyl cis-trans isomerase [Janthinobacterium lividum]
MPNPLDAPAEKVPFRAQLSAHSERRSLILCGAGALIGLVIAGTGLFSAHGTRIAGVPAEDVALVNQVPILMSDYITQLQAQFSVPLAGATDHQKRTVLDAMIREELYVQRGIELGLQSDVIEVRSALVSAVEGQQAVDASSSQPSRNEMLEYYGSHPEKYSTDGMIALSDLSTPDVDRAEAAVAALRRGRPVAAVAAANALTMNTALTDGVEFYFAAKLHAGATLFAIAKSMASGQVSDPIKIGDRFHLLVVLSNTRPVEQSFTAVEPQVLADVRADKTARMQGGADLFLRRRADVQIAKNFR